MSSVNKAGLAAFQSTNALRNMGGTQAMTSTQDEREKHIASLRSLSAWLIANDHDMKLPDDVIDPDLAADFLASLPAPDTAAPCKHCGKGPRAYTHEPFDDSEHEYEPQAPDTSGDVRLMERFNAFLEIVKTFEPEKVALLEFGPEVKRLLERLAAPQAPATGGKFKLGDRVTKTKGSKWTGRVIGFYSTTLTAIGYAVESETETGSVQIYPEAALAALSTGDAEGGV